MIKILYVNGGCLDCGGISSYMMNYFRNIDSSLVKIDFLTQGEGNNLFVKEIELRGGQVFNVPAKSRSFIRNYVQIKKVIKNGNYNIVHSHADAGNAFILMIAKICGVKVRISHSHSSRCYSKNWIKRIMCFLQKRMIKKFATQFWGCSKESCEWLYSKRTNYEIINNAIEVSNFKYDQGVRVLLREKLKISGNCVAMCQVGHLNYIKNQQFSIKLLNRLSNKLFGGDYRLFFIGDGEDRDVLIDIATRCNVLNKIVFLGERKDVCQLLQAMDIMLMPSIFEGFPVTLVEGQASGLFSIVSNNVTRDACIDDNLVKFAGIKDIDIEAWADYCLNMPITNRENASCKIKSAGFDIHKEASDLQSKYIALVNEGRM